MMQTHMKGLVLRQIWLAVALVGSGVPVWAQTMDCGERVTQIEMTECAEQEWIMADSELNAAYRVAMDLMKKVDGNLPKTDRGAVDFLRQAQRDWVSFRDNACAAEGYLMHLGSAEPMVIYRCRARLTLQRTEDLISLGKGYGD
jgi:uncharacterized protein YecT (DUF1311 family)